MTDVRLTATNPVDSSVVPVACNEKGELLLEEPTFSSDYVAKTGDNMTGDLTLGTDKITLNATDGSATFAGSVSALRIGVEDAGSNGALSVADSGTRLQTFVVTGDGRVKIGSQAASNPVILLNSDYTGSAEFAGDVVVGSRNKQWMLVESGGICHLVEQARSITTDLVKNNETQYPELRNLPHELDQLSAVVTALLTEMQRVEEKLRMAPEAGWPVWDGSD